jgi:hypothetical protein
VTLPRDGGRGCSLTPNPATRSPSPAGKASGIGSHDVPHS